MLLRKRNLGILAIIILIPVIGIAWWLLAPLFTSTTVDEEFPFSVTASVPLDMTRAQVEQMMSGIAKVDESANEEMPAPADPATDLSKAMGAGNTETMEAMDSVVKTLAGGNQDAFNFQHFQYRVAGPPGQLRVHVEDGTPVGVVGLGHAVSPSR